MKKFGIFLAGFISGAGLLYVVALIIADVNSNPQDAPENGPENIQGLTLLEQPADVINSPSFEVLQVIEAGNALANAKGDYGYYNGMVVLFIADENTYYYDDQIIKVPNGKCARQIGIYQYETEGGYKKTVPAVAICDK